MTRFVAGVLVGFVAGALAIAAAATEVNERRRFQPTDSATLRARALR